MKYKRNKRWKTMLIICFSVFLSVNNLSAQSILEEVIEQWVNTHESGSYQLENMMEELDELKENPIPINMATKEQLERFPFLSEQLIENILYYIYKHGPMLSDKELMMVEDMDQQTARCLKLFITFQQPEKEECPSVLITPVYHTLKCFLKLVYIPLFQVVGKL